MENLIAGLGKVGFLTGIWIFLVFTVLHELEEWNINVFERRHFSGVPEYATDRSARGVIALVCAAGLVFGAAAALAGNPAAAWIFLPAVFFMVTNAVQHAYWLIRFRRYMPGAATALALVLPGGVYLILWAVSSGYVPALYAAGLAIVSAAAWIRTVREGDRMSPFVRGAYAAGDRVARFLP